MSWSHCSNGEIPDTVDCPSCGLSKTSWTVTVDATRTFVVAQKGRTARRKTSWVEVELLGGAGAAFELELPDGRVVEGRLDDTGVRREEGLYPGECRVRFPGAEVQRVTHAPDDEGWFACATDRRHVFESVAHRAQVLWPDPPASSDQPRRRHTQWVNLAPTPEHADRGSRIRVRIGGGGPGTPVFARVVAAGSNSRRNRPLPGVVAPAPAEDGVVELVSGVDGEATLELELGLAGGDVFEVHVGTTRACADDALEVLNWRRLHVQVTRAAHHAPPALSQVKDALAKVCIDLVALPEVVLAPERAGTPPGAWLRDTDLPPDDPPRPPGPRLVFGNHNQRWFDALLAPGEEPCAHVVVADGIYFGGAPGAPHRQTLEFTLTTPEDPGRLIADASTYDLLPTAVQDGRHCLLHGEWASEAPPGHPDHGRTGAVRPEDLTIRWRTKVLVQPDGITAGDGTPPTGLTATDAATRHPVRVKLEVHVALNAKEGVNVGRQAVVLYTPRSEWLGATIAHELGHALRQAGTVAPPGLDLAAHGRFYKAKGHRGPHCAHGLTDEEFSARNLASFRGSCLMWGAKDEARAPVYEFCERCAPFVRADHCMVLGFTMDDPPTPL